MYDGDNLALDAVVTALRESGIIDRQAVKSIANTILWFADEARISDVVAADELVLLAELIERDPPNWSSPWGTVDGLLH